MNITKYRPDEPKRKSFIYDDYCGDTVYETDDCILLRRRDEMVLNIYAPKTTNWKRLSEHVNDECWAMCFWARDQRKTIKNFEDLPAVEYPSVEVEWVKNDDENDNDNDNAEVSSENAEVSSENEETGFRRKENNDETLNQNQNENENDNEDEYDESDEEDLFMLTWADGWWEMYESGDSYLIRYRLPKCETYPLCCPDDLDALQFLPRDEMWKITGFLRDTYDRVNGYETSYENQNPKENHDRKEDANV